MICSLECVYKGIKETKAGSFTDDKGNTINYHEFYKIRFDQIINGLPKETECKLSKEIALNTAKNLNLYDKIVINFNIIYYSSNNISISINNIKKI